VETDCIVFPRGITSAGYGTLRVAGKLWLAHRWAWTQAHGPIPQGMYVLHRCDYPPCWNVDHLWLGTAADNARDREEKGRHGSQGRAQDPASIREAVYAARGQVPQVWKAAPR
jgi:HNH endonuclease